MGLEPPWARYPDAQRVSWLAAITRQLWPFAAAYATRWIEVRQRWQQRSWALLGAPHLAAAVCMCRTGPLSPLRCTACSAVLPPVPALEPGRLVLGLQDTVPGLLEANKPPWMRSIKLAHCRWEERKAGGLGRL